MDTKINKCRRFN